jgi:two-component system, chemotaxis family, CheB/CheR fusion protein
MNEELRMRNKELKEIAEYAETVVEAIREPILVLNNNLRVNIANKAFYSYFKLNPATVEGNFLHQVGNGLFDRAEINDPLTQLLTDRKIFQQSECKLELQGAAEANFLFHLVRMNGGSGRRARILIAIEAVDNHKLNGHDNGLTSRSYNSFSGK